MWDSGLILVVTGEQEVPVKALVGSVITCSGMTYSERSVRYVTVYLQQKFYYFITTVYCTVYMYVQQKFNVVGFAFIYVLQTIHTHSNAYKCGYMDSMQQQLSWLTTSRPSFTLQ